MESQALAAKFARRLHPATPLDTASRCTWTTPCNIQPKYIHKSAFMPSKPRRSSVETSLEVRFLAGSVLNASWHTHDRGVSDFCGQKKACLDQSFLFSPAVLPQGDKGFENSETALLLPPGLMATLNTRGLPTTHRRAHTLQQYAIIGKNFDVSGFDPASLSRERLP